MKINQHFVVDPLVVVHIQLLAADKGHVPDYLDCIGWSIRIRMSRYEEHPYCCGCEE